MTEPGSRYVTDETEDGQVMVLDMSFDPARVVATSRSMDAAEEYATRLNEDAPKTHTDFRTVAKSRIQTQQENR